MFRNHIQIRGSRQIFTYIPKAGCTWWKTLFLVDLFGSDLPHDVHSKGSGLTYLNNAEAEHCVRNHSFEMGAMIRDPKTRFLSAYRDKIKRNMFQNFDSVSDIHYWKMANTFASEVGLKKTMTDAEMVSLFLPWMRENAVDRYDEHFAKQTDILIGGITYRYWSLFEQFDDSSKAYLESIGKADIEMADYRNTHRTGTGATDVNELGADLVRSISDHYIADEEIYNKVQDILTGTPYEK